MFTCVGDWHLLHISGQMSNNIMSSKDYGALNCHAKTIAPIFCQPTNYVQVNIQGVGEFIQVNLSCINCSSILLLSCICTPRFMGNILATLFVGLIFNIIIMCLSKQFGSK